VKRFKTLVPDASHRVQLIHHASATSIPWVLYNISDEFEIMRVVLIQFDIPSLKMYHKFVTLFTIDYLDWVPSENLSSDIQWDILEAKGISKDTVEEGFAMFHALDAQLISPISASNESNHSSAHSVVSSSNAEVPIYTFSMMEYQFRSIENIKRIVPAVVALWNASKSEVDIFSRLLSNYKIINPRSTGLFMWQRMFMMGMATSYRIFQLLKLSDRIIGPSNSIKSYSPFDKYLLKVADHFQECAKRERAEESIINSNMSISTSSRGFSTVSDTAVVIPSVAKKHRSNITGTDAASKTERDELNAIRFDNEKEHLVHRVTSIKPDNRGLCVVCCRIRGTDAGNGIHTRKGPKITTRCSIRGIFLCNETRPITKRDEDDQQQEDQEQHGQVEEEEPNSKRKLVQEQSCWDIWHTKEGTEWPVWKCNSFKQKESTCIQ